MEWTRTFGAERYDAALAGWRWLGLDGLTAQFTSYFGDVFLSSADGWWFLDTIEGNLKLTWPTREALEVDLATEEGQNRYLLAPLAEAAQRRGLTLGPDQVFDFMPPPVLGGSFDVANITVEDFVISINIAGQLHQQLRDRPPGTPIGQITIEGP
ncbi:hypothetical protein GCM10009682_05760 [Luedemannella flava]|uniref:T6SS immunity protein Tdi1 C-terminal domain-containing protein n=1 Tax=Luedemannella flava TaxID=349316 RepID=A0ABP4XKM6_9ACTN